MTMPDKFFEKVMKPDWQRSYKLLASRIMDEFSPRSVVDYGACAGWMLEYLRRHGVKVLCGIEPAKAAAKFSPDSIKPFMFFGDLTESIELGHNYDLSVCLEVGEHIDKKHAGTVVRNVVAHSSTVLWSAATPGQGGCGHVNEQPHEYWIDKFLSVDYVSDVEASVRVRKALRAGGAKKWYHRNAMVFRSNK